jgi:hypothetical protein
MWQRVFLLCVTFLVLGGEAVTQAEVFKNVRLRSPRSQKDNRLTFKDVHLIVDETAGKLTLKSADESQAKPTEIKFAQIAKVVFEATSHGRSSFPLSGVVGMAVASKKVQDYWCYFEYQSELDGQHKVLLEIDKNSSEKVVQTLRTLLGGKVTEFETVSGEDFERKTLPDGETKYQLAFSKTHPFPTVKPDASLIVAVFPTGSMSATTVHKLHANDKVILGNVSGTYSFAYLPPGEYQFASQCGTANGMKLKVEAGQAYYFVQSARASLKSANEGALLSRDSPDLVLYEVAGARYVELQPPGTRSGKSRK